MSVRKIRIGILGCADIARRSVIPAIRTLSNMFELKYVASRTGEKAEEFSRLFDCRPVTGYDKLINSEDLDALYIPLPTRLHKEWINRALLAGKHVYAEKSIAYSFQEAQEMVENANKMGVGLMEGFMFLYHSQHKTVLKLLNDGIIGEPRYFASYFGFPPLAPGNFRYSEELGGGALLDAAGYTIRATHFIMGNDVTVKAATLFTDIGKGTNIFGSAFLSDSNGTGASVAFGFDHFYRCSYEIWGERGKITAGKAFTPGPDFSPPIIIECHSGITTIQAEPDNHFIHAFEEFYNMMENSEMREKHCADILLQSQSLDLIRNFSKRI